MGYHTMAPQSQLYGQTFIANRRRARLLALTFDDGPNDPWTPKLLDVLAQNRVRATFFMIGRYVRQKPEIARAIAEAGHVVGNHTFSHPNLIFCTAEQVRRQIADCEATLHDAGIPATRLFRPPFGGRTPFTLRTIRRAAYQPIMWSNSSYDWTARSAKAIARKVGRQLRGGDVILLHDGGHQGMATDRGLTIAATREIVLRCLDTGYDFVTVPELML